MFSFRLFLKRLLKTNVNTLLMSYKKYQTFYYIDHHENSILYFLLYYLSVKKEGVTKKTFEQGCQAR